MYKVVNKKVKEIFSNFGIVNAPIPIEEIITKLGIKISYAPSIDYSGMIVKKKDGKALIGVNSNEPYTRARYTMAHELAHYFFEKASISIDHRDNFSRENKPEKEKRADYFAANLLMPDELIKKDFFGITKNKVFLEEHLSYLANFYQVSKEAMNYRLLNLGLISRDIK
ncbi:MAG: ImmA/IrrE family metallo-endopeptidase [bacterium]|nr:ImmA/IrrE family metallo-endopeptidase [bacterium]